MSKIKCVIAFIFGAAVGAAVTGKILSNRYERLVQEEVASVKEHLGKHNNLAKKDSNPFVDDEEEFEDEYYQRTLEYGSAKPISGPRVIHPDEFGMRDDYETRTLKCFADRVVTDLDDEVIEDVDSLIGDESLDHFGEYGEYEPNSVYVRNDRLKLDIEILLVGNRYCPDVTTKTPHQAED